MDKSSSGPSVGEVGGTGDESESGAPQPDSRSACDACEGCDDVCDSKRMTHSDLCGSLIYSVRELQKKASENSFRGTELSIWVHQMSGAAA